MSINKIIFMKEYLKPLFSDLDKFEQSVLIRQIISDSSKRLLSKLLEDSTINKYSKTVELNEDDVQELEKIMAYYMILDEL